MSPSSSLWSLALKQNASDVHVMAGCRAMLRVNGELTPVTPKPLTAAEVKKLIDEFLTPEQQKKFTASGDVDCSHQLEDGTRLRINCHVVSGQPAFAARVVPNTIPTVKDILLPDFVMNLCRSEDGLVIFTGPTGCGKSTSLAAIIATLAEETALNIITLEDPIEFMFKSEKSMVRQRELGSDFPAFAEGLKHVLRQDPDVVMVGEMRDLETIALALTLAETGHLVLATLHTPNTTQTIDRIVDVFPPHQQQQVRLQVALSLKAVVAQKLLPKKGGGLIANREILVRTPAVSNIIRENRLQELISVLQTSRDEGMVTFDKDLKRLVKEGLVEG